MIEQDHQRRTDFSRKVVDFKQSLHWEIFEDKLQDDWGKLNTELRNTAQDNKDTGVVAGKLAYIKELFDWYDISSKDHLRVLMEKQLIEDANDY